MTPAAFGYLFTAVLMNTAAQLLLKAGTNALGVLSLTRGEWSGTLARIATQPYFLAGVTIYMVSLVVWIVGLSRVPVSIAFPLLSLGYVLNAFAAWWLFGETLSVSRWLGIGCIVLGVWLVARA
jgi:multidrug transporter EmrE-like cation transporter